MKLFYNPSFSGGAYVDFSKSPVLFDAKVVNTAGLCKILRLHAGICSNEKDYGTRFVDYYAAMKKFMEKNPDNLFASSFNIDKLNTAKKCLEWRDTLAAAGWTKTAPAPTERTKALCGIEQIFNDKCTGEELWELVAAVKNGCPLPELELIVSSYYEDFSPAEVALIKALIERGVDFTAEKVEPGQNNIAKIYSVLQGKSGIELDTSDDSFEIWNFAERDDAIKYLSLLDASDFDVWINTDNKEFDNWQKLEGKRLSGSQISGIPHAAQLLNIALTIFERPLNVYNIVEWLNTSPNPLASSLRGGLAYKICKSGGYYNDDCRKFIEKYVSDYPDSQEKISKFLPDINNPIFEEGDIEVSAIREFVENLSQWCAKSLSQNKGKDPSVDQLGFVINQAKSLLMFLDEYDSKTIPYSDLRQLASAFSNDITMEQYSAQVQCKRIVNSFADFCQPAPKTVWCDFYECGNAGKLTYSFLSPSEQEVFKKDLKLWEPDRERSYIRNLLLTPFAKTKSKLVLVTIDKIGSADAPKSPIYIQLEKYFADKDDNKDFKKNKLNPFIKHMELDKSLLKAVDKIDNRMEKDQEFVKIKKTAFIKDNWEDHQSYSSLESFIQHPLDYVIDHYVNFSANPLDTMPDLSTTKGYVAHDIIEKLFGPKEGEKDSGTVAYIRKQIAMRFEDVFKETVQSKGAILLLEVNKMELNRFKSQVKESLDALLKVIEANKLKVFACEKKIGYQTDKDDNIISHGIIGNLDVKGFADMVLVDEAGAPYIFDFKWTSSSKRHATILEEKKSVQLTLYKELVSKEMKKKVKAVAYFLMPAAQFISYEELNGVKQIVVQPERKNKDLLKEIQNSYEYRKDEVFKGNLEEATSWTEDKILYEKKRDEEERMPLDYYEEEKCGPYSDVGLIKRRK